MSGRVARDASSHRIAALEPNSRYEIWDSGERTVCVDPWPFRAEAFRVQVGVRTLHQLKFRTDRELEQCLQDCAVEEQCWKVLPE